jgi:endonuclease/exonuclease/phosphatase family metal-dependent hydrolase
MFNFLLPLLLTFNPVNTDPIEMKVMTFNIRNGTLDDGPNAWSSRNNIVFSLLEEYDCDFVGLQEALGFQLEDILGALPKYEMIGRTRDISPYEGESCAILFNKEKWELVESGHFWLSEDPKIPGSKSWGASLPRICTMGKFRNKTGGQVVHIYNTHLDHISTRAREESSGVIIRHINKNRAQKNLVIMGDFNSSEFDMPINYLVQNEILNVQDAYRQKHKRISEEDATYYGWGEHNPAIGARVDYILSSRSLRILSCNVVDFRVSNRYPSDHSPVIAVLEISR